MKTNFILIASMALCLISCNKSNNEDVVADFSEADAFVTSEKFQAYQTVVKSERKFINGILKQLSRDDKKQCKYLIQTICNEKDYGKQIPYISKIDSLLGINTIRRVLFLGELSAITFAGVKISKSEYLKAIQKYNMKMNKLRFTRSGGEDYTCLNDCYINYLSAEGDCHTQFLMYEDPEEEWEEVWKEIYGKYWEDEDDWRDKWTAANPYEGKEYLACLNIAYWDYGLCIDTCD